MLNISDKEVAAFSKYILDISSIYLDKSKGYLLETRLKKMLDQTGSKSYGALLDNIRADSTEKLKIGLIDAISTNETFFFRDDVPFNLLRNKIIPDLIDLRRKQHPSRPVRIKIWSAACSTGQEVYSIAMTLLEMLSGMGSFEISILGTDISDEAVAMASYGKYNSFEIERGLPKNMRQKYFTRAGEGWRIKDEIRSLAKFEKMNLMRPFPPSIGSFDIVFCRNVAIYFQSRDKVNLFRNIAKVTAPGGSLIVGGSENLLAVAPDFTSQQYLRGMYYILKSDQGIIKQNPVPTRLPRERKRPPISSGRKTVYDTKRPVPATKIKEVSPEKKTPHPDAAVSPVLKPDVEEAITLVQKTDAEQIPTSLADKLNKRKGPQKTLLNSMQDKKKQGASLLNGQGKAKGSKGSLLGKLKARK